MKDTRRRGVFYREGNQKMHFLSEPKNKTALIFTHGSHEDEKEASGS